MSTNLSSPGEAASLDAALVSQTVPPGSLRYYALLYAPPDKRAVLVALHLLDDELTATGRSLNHDVAHTRLKWWQEELDRLQSGKPAHPATRALMAVRGTELKNLQGLIDAAAIDLARATFADDGELASHFERSGGALAAVAARWLSAPGIPPATAIRTATQLGSLCRHVESLRDLRLNAHAGRIQLSLAALETAGIDVSDLLAAVWPATLQAMLQSVRTSLQANLNETMAGIPGSERAMLRPLLVQAGLYLKLLDRIGEQIAASMPAPAELSPFDKLLVSWRAARAAR